MESLRLDFNKMLVLQKTLTKFIADVRGKKQNLKDQMQLAAAIEMLADVDKALERLVRLIEV